MKLHQKMQQPPQFTQFWCDRKCVVSPFTVKGKVSRRVKSTFAFLWGGVSESTVVGGTREVGLNN